MPRWIQVLFSKPEEPLTPLAKYTMYNGVFYMGLGGFLYAMPTAMGPAGARAFAGQEEPLYRVLGMVVAIIGWFYFIGGRTNKDSFGLATFADRILVPAFIAPLIFWTDIDPMLVLPVAILDPILGIGAFVIWSRQSK